MDSVNLSSLDNFTLLSFRDGVDMRPTLLRVLTDLYVQKATHTADEERHYTELALRLLDVVDVATRAAVAARLGRHLAAPLQVIARLAVDLPDVAAAVRGHPLLLAERAQRPRLTAAVAAAGAPLPPQPDEVSRPPAPVVAAVAPASSATMASDERTPQPQFTRNEVERDELNRSGRPASVATYAIASDMAAELNELFFAASADERRLILLNLPIAVPRPAGRIALITDGALTHRLEAAALARNREQFAQLLAQALHIPRAQARRIAADDLGEPIVTAGKALAIPRDVLYRILLFVNATIGHSVSRVHALSTLYDEMTLEAAEHLVAIWQALPGNEHTVAPAVLSRPLLRDEEARARARTATATVRRAPTARRLSDQRDAS